MNRKEIVERQQAILDAAKRAVNLRQRKQESLKACREA